MSNPKLFLVVRGDLSPAQQAVQAAHALQEFNVLHPTQVKRWYTDSNHLALLVVPDEAALRCLAQKVERLRYRMAPFHEPDRKGELTAIALEPEARRFCKGLPLALA